MIVLDTNIISEIFKIQPNEQVMSWLASQSRASLFTTSVTYAELLYGVAILPHGKKQNTLRQMVQGVFKEDFAGYILGFDEQAAVIYADIANTRKSIGQPITQFDAMIAAICKRHNAILATHKFTNQTKHVIRLF